jgi:aldose 1-epimerase
MRDAPEERLAPSGRQLTITHGPQRAIVTEVGAGLREYTVDDEPVVWPFGVLEMSGGGRGQLLAPWPNRIEDGTYSFNGVPARAALDEPDRRNAIHGLVRWLSWRVDDAGESAVSLSCVLAPQPGYPWRLLLTVRYEVGDDGLLVEASAENLSGETAPFGMGAHPYLDTGPQGADGCVLQLQASRHLLLDDRGIPSGSEGVSGTAFDFAAGRSLSGVRLDDCFADIGAAGEDTLPARAAWQAQLTRQDGTGSALWADEAWPYVMCYTGDTLAAVDRRRGVAIEPMTCPPNALRSGESLVIIAPGGTWSGRFGIRRL